VEETHQPSAEKRRVSVADRADTGRRANRVNVHVDVVVDVIVDVDERIAATPAR